MLRSDKNRMSNIKQIFIKISLIENPMVYI